MLAVRLPQYKRSPSGMAKQILDRRVLFAAGLIVAIALCAPLLVIAGTTPVRSREIDAISLQAREQKIWRFPVHDSEFADVPHITAKSRCENTRAPEALTTPNPILDSFDPEVKIQVSFIVGTDGRVHSPLILQSAGNNDIRAVLDTVRSWRYRPAMCNGVPTETEGKIQFSAR
jgi:TonB family protein